MNPPWAGRTEKLVDLGYFMEDHNLEAVEWKFKVGRKRRLNATLVCKEVEDGNSAERTG